MRPIKVEFQAFGPYAGHEMVDFDSLAKKGLFLICGKTGIGKTMILDAMTFALYGKSSGHGRDDFEAMRCTNADRDTYTFVKFEFENNGIFYIFERRLEYKRKNLSASYNVMKKNPEGDWAPLFENAKEKLLNDKAVEIIGLEYEQFRQVIVLPQGQFEKLLTSNSDEKEKILTNIFGEEKWQAIAENFYKEAFDRKNALKEKQDRINSILDSLNCNSMEGLSELLECKKNKLAEINEAYKLSDYDGKIRSLQEIQVLSKRFADLYKAKERVESLKNRSEEFKTLDNRLKDAARAEKVRILLEDSDNALLELNKRKEEEQDLKEKAATAMESAENAALKLKEHLDKANGIEDKKTLKIQYEGRREDYRNLEAVKKELLLKEQAEKTAKASEENAEKKLKAYVPAIAKLNDEYNRLKDEHTVYFNTYMAGITGEIAAELEAGKPCPVCGSTTHPHKAVKADDSITKEMVNAKKMEEDAKYNEIQEMLGKEEQAKQELDEKHRNYETKHVETATCKSKFDSITNNLIKGILNLTGLENAIVELADEINKFEKTKAALEEKNQVAQKACTEAKAKTEPAAKETENAKIKYEKSMAAVEIGLRDNGFETAADAKKYLLTQKEIDEISEKQKNYETDCKAADSNLQNLEKELKGKEAPDTEKCQEELDRLSEANKNYVRDKGILEYEINDLKSKKKMLETEGKDIEEQILEANDDFIFAKQLRGDSGTGLQRYVLGIMFSSVIVAANRMLEMVHGGRYHLFRSDDKAQGSNKKGLELKVFDKNSAESEGRFVSTLSGGEKFLVSLALSIGMSTVAQKSGIRIEALFIDEGFGSLDDESIEDAMNVLNSIKEASGMVGIISHVQLLQDRIPTKLKVEEIQNGSHIIQSIG